MPVMFMNRIMKKIVVRIGRNRSAVLLAEQVVRDVGADEAQTHLDEALEAARDDRHLASAEPEDQHDGDGREDLDDVDSRDRNPEDRRDDGREEFIDRRGVEFAAVFGGVGDQCRSVNEQRGLQLRGIGVNRCDDGR